MVYTNDKKTRLTLRLNEKQFAFVQQSSEQYGVSPSEFLRMVINASMYQANKFDKALEEVTRRENEQTHFDN